MDRIPVERIQSTLTARILKVTLPRSCDEICSQKLLYGMRQRGLTAKSMLFVHHAPGCCHIAVIPPVVLEGQRVQ